MANKEIQENPRSNNFNASDELLSCSFCHQLVSTEQIIPTRNKKYACEECFDPTDPEQQEENLTDINLNKEKVKEKHNDFNLSYTFTSKDKKTNEKAIEINSEELNNAVDIPKELKIIDCPPDIKDDKE
jgi:hypothetical protein